MSHYSTLVIIPPGVPYQPYLDEVLRPYDENLVVAAYPRYTAAEVQATFERERAKLVARTTPVDNDYDIVLMQDDVVMWAEAYYGRAPAPDGCVYSTSNPQGRWDWWELGGRYAHQLCSASQTCNVLRVGELDWAVMARARESRLRKAWEHGAAVAPEVRQFLYKIEPTDTWEDYLAREGTGFSTWAVLTTDGVLHERAQMGWFGQALTEYEEAQAWREGYRARFIDPLTSEHMLAMCDLHI